MEHSFVETGYHVYYEYGEDEDHQDVVMSLMNVPIPRVGDEVWLPHSVNLECRTLFVKSVHHWYVDVGLMRDVPIAVQRVSLVVHVVLADKKD